MQDWVRRRVENLRFLDDRTIAHEVELHIDLRYVDPRIVPHAPNTDRVLLPLMVLERSKHTAIDVYDSSGAVVGRLNRDEERKLVADGIACRCIGLGDPRIAIVRDHIFDYLNAPPIETDVNGPRLLRWLRDVLMGLVRLIDIAAGRDGGAPPAVNARTLLIRDLREAGASVSEIADALPLIDNFRDRHLLLADLPYQAEHGSFVVRLQYVEGVPVRELSFVRTSKRLIAGTLSWSARVPVRAVKHAAGFHMNVYAPPGFKVVDSSLLVRGRSAAGGPERLDWYFDNDRLPTASHVFVRPDDVPTEATVDLYVSLYSNRTGFFLESWLLSVAVAFLFIGFSMNLSAKGFALQSSSKGPAAFDPNFAATLLLLFPALAVTIISQRDEHRLSSRTFAQARFLLFALALGSVGSSLPFAMQLAPRLATWVWFASASICWTVAVRFTLGGFLHLWRLSGVRSTVLRAKRQIENAAASALVSP